VRQPFSELRLLSKPSRPGRIKGRQSNKRKKLGVEKSVFDFTDASSTESRVLLSNNSFFLQLLHFLLGEAQ